MSLKVTRIFARETALIAGVGLFSSVSALVYFQISRSSARIVALVALERVFSSVHVCYKTTSFTARIYASFTPKYFFPRMGPDVHSEITS